MMCRMKRLLYISVLGLCIHAHMDAMDLPVAFKWYNPHSLLTTGKTFVSRIISPITRVIRSVPTVAKINVKKTGIIASVGTAIAAVCWFGWKKIARRRVPIVAPVPVPEEREMQALVQQPQQHIAQDIRPATADQETQTDVGYKSPRQASQEYKVSIGGSLVLSEELSSHEGSVASPDSSSDSRQKNEQEPIAELACDDQAAQQIRLLTEELLRPVPLTPPSTATSSPSRKTEQFAKWASIRNHPEEVFALLGFGAQREISFRCANKKYIEKLEEAQKALKNAKNKEYAMARLKALQSIGTLVQTKVQWNNFCAHAQSHSSQVADGQNGNPVEMLRPGSVSEGDNVWARRIQAARDRTQRSLSN